MGIALRFTGSVEDPSRAGAVVEHLRARGEEIGWDADPGEGTPGSVAFRLSPEGGLFSLRFAPDGSFAGSADTGEAGPEEHRAVCLLLVEAGHRFGLALDVEDGAGYFDRWDDRALRAVWRGEGGPEGHGARARERRRSLRHLAASAFGVVAMLAAGLALLEAVTGSLLDGRWWLLLALAAYLASGALRPREEGRDPRESTGG